MLRRLRIRLICVLMGVFTVMLCILLGLVIFLMKQRLEFQSVQMMRSLVEEPFPRAPVGKPPEDVRLPFFTVQIDRKGEVKITDGGYFDFTDEKILERIVEQSAQSEEQSGILEEFHLRYYKSRHLKGGKIVFADMSQERATMVGLVNSCMLIGSVCFCLFLIFSIVLARRLVRPVEQAWQQQRQFVADASHELKTPLTVIMTNAELLQDDVYPETERRKFSENILTMSRQMRSLVEGLLELARVDNGTDRMNYAPLDMSELVCDSLLPFEPLFFEKVLQLSMDVEPGITLTGSAPQLGQVLEVLLDNALKYSEPGEVTVRLKRHGGHCLLSVANPGIPLSREEREIIFKRFYRGDKARSRDGSFGLGLSIAQRIVEEHRGKIWAESDSGINTFFVQLRVNSSPAR